MALIYFNSPPSPRYLARVAYQILQALTYLNQQDMTHRALSADNILLTPEVRGQGWSMLWEAVVAAVKGV